jgi:TetR/AcrR family transcriptional regulator, cholesterol catabolism regulator
MTKAAKGRPKRRRRDRRAELHAAAIKVFQEKGYAHATIQDLAEEVGVLKGSVYHYISSKEDLLKTILDDAYTARTELIAQTDGIEDPAEHLRQIIELYVVWHIEHVEEARIVRRESRHLTGRLKATTKRRTASFGQFLLGLIEEAQAATGKAGLPEPPHVLRHILGAVESIPEWHRPSGSDRPADIATIYAHLSLNALAPSPAGTRAAS